MTENSRAKMIEKPIIILGCNRSGTTLLFKNLSSHPDVWSLYIESQDIFYKHYPIDDKFGDRITEPPDETVDEDIKAYFYKKCHNKEYYKDTRLINHIPAKYFQRPFSKIYKRPPIRIVEKTPANCFRVPFLNELFPDAKIIFVIRRAEDVISSLMEGWKNWSHCTNRKWQYTKWHYLVPEKWKDWKHKTLQEICAFQWIQSNQMAWKDLKRYRKENFLFLRHEDIMENPVQNYKDILEYCELRSSNYFNDQIKNIDKRIFTTGGSAPKKEKWKELHYTEIESVRYMFEPLLKQFYPDR